MITIAPAPITATSAAVSIVSPNFSFFLMKKNPAVSAMPAIVSARPA